MIDQHRKVKNAVNAEEQEFVKGVMEKVGNIKIQVIILVVEQNLGLIVQGVMVTQGAGYAMAQDGEDEKVGKNSYVMFCGST